MTRNGERYAPRGAQEIRPLPEEFPVAAVGLDHGHIYAMCHGLRDAGATIVGVYDPDAEKVRSFQAEFPEANRAPSVDALLKNPEVRMIASAAVPSDRCALGLRVQEAGKHFFVDKAPFTTLAQLEAAERSVEATGKKWAVCYSERLLSEAAVFAGQLIEEGALGRVIQVIGLGPHRLRAENRPDWFFRKEKYGGILTDIGSHQVEQFLYFAGAEDASVAYSQVGNLAHPEFPELEDFGDTALRGNNGAVGYFRVDWFTPDGLSTWGDGRTVILGTEGYLELRKYVDIAREESGNHCYLVDSEGEHCFKVSGKVGFPYFSELIADCIEGTENAMTQQHAFRAAEIALRAQAEATVLRGEGR